MRQLARWTLAISAVGSLVLMLIHGRPSVFLVILFTGWILAPFIALLWADKFATAWPASARTTLYYVMLLVSVGSVAIYLYDVLTGYGRAVFFVAVPIIDWLVILVVLSIAVFLGRRSIPRTPSA
ncbi:MAG TPA: hypothetical protein VG454_06060 [Gemmatimonadales bacterium]|nr:hypothetical protein [Gemmatimonadales bacterium]